MSVTVWQELIVDRMNVSIAVSKALHGDLVAILKSMLEVAEDLAPTGALKISEKHFLTRLDWYVEKKRRIAELEVGSTKSAHRYFRIGLYPSKFKPGDFEHFKWVLSVLMPWPYGALYADGRVTYIELAADSLSQVAHSFIPFRPKCAYSLIYFDHAGNAGTTYLGSQTSSLRFRIYDKRRQLEEKGQKAPYDPHTRIEAIARHTGLAPSELPQKLANHFERLEIADLQAARQLTKEQAWQAFLDDCLSAGSATALASCTPNQRRLYVRRLRKSAAGWWMPKEIWKGLPSALAATAP